MCLTIDIIGIRSKKIKEITIDIIGIRSKKIKKITKLRVSIDHLKY